MPILLLSLLPLCIGGSTDSTLLKQAFKTEVDRRLEVPDAERLRYADELARGSPRTTLNCRSTLS